MITLLGTREHSGVVQKREACFSEDGRYRYRLEILWDSTKGVLPMIGLNPSVANQNDNDPTIRREIDFAIALGFGGLRKLNAFAWISTDYKALFRSPDPIGPENGIDYLRHWCDGPMTIACWGAHITERSWRHYYRGRDLAEAIPNLYAFRKTQSGHPQHPLYLPKTSRPEPFSYD